MNLDNSVPNDLIEPRNTAIRVKDNSDTSLLTSLKPKANPDSLAEIISSSDNGIGAFIYVKSIIDSKITNITNNFYLTGLSINFKERVQLLENFKSANVSFFGDSAKVYQLQGVAVDFSSTDLNDPGQYYHQSGLIDMYNNVLRGSKLIENNSIAILKVLNHSIEGYPINFHAEYSSATDKMAQFSMAWVVIKHDLLLDKVLTDTRLKSFYNKNTTDNIIFIDGIISKIENTFNLRNRQIDTNEQKFEYEDEFFDLFGSSESLYILEHAQFIKMLKKNGKPMDAAKGFLNKLVKYFTNIVSKLKTNSIGINNDILNDIQNVPNEQGISDEQTVEAIKAY